MRMRTVFSVRRTVGLPIALVAAVVVAEAAVLVLRPRDLGPAPLPVEARAYFSQDQLEKAETFRTGQLWLYGATLLIEGGVLVLFVRRPPQRLRDAGRPPSRAGRRGRRRGAVGRGRARPAAGERDRAGAGPATSAWSPRAGWAGPGDVAKSQAIGALFAAGGGALLIGGMRRFGRRWWIPGAAVVVAFGVIVTYAGPVVLDPLFNTFKRLPDGQTRSDVLTLARRAGVDVGQVYEIDASRRTSAANAYVNGLGHTKRVVLYDNLLKEFTPAELRLVVAHELGHVRHRDVPRGLLYLLIVAPFGMFAVARLGERLAPEGSAGTPLALPGVLLAVALVSTVIQVESNQLSRAVERSADGFALELTRRRRRRRSRSSAGSRSRTSRTPTRPAWVTFLLGTHPPTIERIGQAEAAARASSREG